MPNEKYILGIDPGNKESAFCLCSPDLHPLEFGKYENTVLIKRDPDPDTFEGKISAALLNQNCDRGNTVVVIENMESFGMAVGRSVLDTCIYIGELKRHFMTLGYPVEYVFRHEEKVTICLNIKANDATIKQALVDRFAPNTSNHGKGTKKEPGFFHNFRADVWSSFAIAVTYHDKQAMKDLHLEELPF